MNKKIIGILICFILTVSTIIPVAVGLDEKNNTKTETIDPVPLLYFKQPPIINIGNIPLTLENKGTGTAENITYELKVIDGPLFSPKDIEGSHPSLGPGEKLSVNLKITGLGFATILFNCRYTIAGIPGCGVEFQIQEEWRDLGLLFLHLFLPSMQPKKEWVQVEDYIYHNETDQESVELYLWDILQRHNVRVSEGSKSDSRGVLFKACCKFVDGIGVLEECGITRSVVEGGEAVWEVELVNGE